MAFIAGTGVIGRLQTVSASSGLLCVYAMFPAKQGHQALLDPV